MFASKNELYVKADASTPDEVDAEVAAEKVRRQQSGQVAQASQEVHGDIVTKSKK